jgi:HlyD family secretion protein
VVISARNPDLSLLPGMTANVRIVVEQRESALKVPNAALRFRPAGVAEARPQADAAPAQPARGQAMQQFRDRLVAEIKPDAAQQAQLEAIFAGQQQKFAALRALTDEAERRKQGERLRAELRAQVEGVLRAEQKPAYERLLRGLVAGSTAATGRVWIAAGGAPRPVDLRLGLSDGTSTEVLGGDLAEGAEVIVGLAPGSERNGAGLPRMRLF